MIEGLENDDRYRMVEDEFAQVAGSFTAHLHAAEYQRQKQIAKSQNAETIQSISRPVTGSMTNEVKQRRSALHRIARQRAGLKETMTGEEGADLDEDVELPWAGTSLQGLMNSSSRKPAVQLSTVAPTISNTRAAAGYLESSARQPSMAPSRATENVRQANWRPAPSKRAAPPTDDSEDDDLEGPSIPLHPKPPVASTIKAAVPDLPAPQVRPSAPATSTSRRLPPQEDDGDLSDGLDSADFLRRARERRAQQKAKRVLH